MHTNARRYWVALTASLVFLGAAAQADNAVPTDPAQARPLPVGSKLPDFTVRTVEGAPYKVSAAKLERPTLLIFYRGGWCPYCNTHLSALRETEPKLRELGYDVLFLSSDRPEMLRSSLKDPKLGYTLLSDSRMEAARSLGIAFQLDEGTVTKYREYGVDLDKTTGETHHQLPVPSVFIVDRGGTIRFVYSNPDYKVRIKADELLAAAQRVAQDGGKAAH